MKKFFLLSLMAVAVIAFASCGKEPAANNPAGPDSPEVPQAMDIVHTSWQGVYSGTVVHPQAGTLPCVLTWTMDFVDETNVSILLEVVTGGQAQQPQEMACTYTYDGRRGEIVSEEDGEVQRDPFEIDPVNRTFTIDLRITTGFSQENPQVVGGLTTFHQIRKS